jgi:hypothetical protein
MARVTDFEWGRLLQMTTMNEFFMRAIELQ